MDTAIIAGLLGIVATLLGVFFAIYLQRRNARRDSGRELIAVFAKAITAFNQVASSNSSAIDPVLRETFPHLEEKINIFKEHLFWPWEKRGFKKAWIAYYNISGDNRCQSYLHYIPFGSNKETYKEMFKNNINNILRYATQK